MSYLALAVATFFVGNLVGYIVHYALHDPKMGKMYEAHDWHHRQIYPIDRFLSSTYDDPPSHAEQAIYYVVPMLVLVAPLAYWSWPHGLVAIIELLAVLKLNAYLHDSLHVEGHKLLKYAWFHRIRTLHYQHHVDPSKNLGIFFWVPDKLLRTYENRTDFPPTML